MAFHRFLTHCNVARALLAAGALTAAMAAGTGQAAAAAPTSCTKVASLNGSDSASGTASAPFRTVQHLVESLSQGETGCLRAGAYGGADVRMGTPDTALQSYPGERATLTAYLEVHPSAVRARVSGLKIDTTGNANTVGTKLQADDTVFSDNEVTKGGDGICVVVGSTQNAERIVVERNRIYNCGSAVKKDGSVNKYDHQIYLVKSRNAIIRWNILSSNAGGWGVHLYPDADGTLVEHNIIDANQGGVIFAGDGSGSTADANIVRNNALTYSGPRYNAESSWSGGPSGVGNTVTTNCVYSTGPSQLSGIGDPDGFVAAGNIELGGSPYVNRGRGDYHFRSDSLCATLVGDVADAVGGPVPPPPGARNASENSVLLITIRAKPGERRIRPVRVTGKVVARRTKSVSRVALQVKTRHGWKTFARRHVRHGRFAARLRVRRLYGRRVARLRAVVPGRARSRTVAVRVRS